MHGVRLTKNGKVTNVIARWNRLIGIAANGSTISDNTSSENGDQGIAGSFVVIRDNAVNGNLGDGIRGSTGSTISGNTVTQNGGDGIVDFGGSLIERNAVHAHSHNASIPDTPSGMEALWEWACTASVSPRTAKSRT